MIDLREGDAVCRLLSVQSNSIDSLVTDPPAGISFMNKEWDNDKGGRVAWIAWMQEIAQECLRVLKPGAHGLVWALPRTSHWTATALENAGFEIRDVVNHIFGSGFPKSLDVSKAIDKSAGAEREVVGKTYGGIKPSGGFGADGTRFMPQSEKFHDKTIAATTEAKQWQGWGTALKPAHEHWILVRKPLSEKTVAANVLKWGTGALNIDASRIGTDDTRSKVGGTKNTENWRMAGGVIAGSENGRFPANLLLSEDAAQELDEHSGLRPSGGGASRFFFVCKEEPKHVNQSVCKDTNANIATSSFLISQEIEKIASTIFAQENAPLFLDLANLYLNALSAENPVKSIETEHAHVLVKTLFKKDLQSHHCLVSILEQSDLILPLCHALIAEMQASTDIMKIMQTPTQLFGFASYVIDSIITLVKRDPNLKLPPIRFIYQSKASKSDKGADNTHPTVKNTKLMEYLIKLITPPNGTILDPFMGSGSTGVAAKRLGFDFLGIEQNEDYFEISRNRLYE